jgi:hypothetical protein
MSYSTVIVHLDLGSTAERRVKLAGSLADRFDARLIGVAAQPCYLPVSGIATACAPGLVENEQDRIRDELAQAEAVSVAGQEPATVSSGARLSACRSPSSPNRRGQRISSW